MDNRNVSTGGLFEHRFADVFGAVVTTQARRLAAPSMIWSRERVTRSAGKEKYNQTLMVKVIHHVKQLDVATVG